MPTSTAYSAEMLGVPPTDVFETLEVYLGSAYVNDFNYLGRTYRVHGAGRRRRSATTCTTSPI